MSLNTSEALEESIGQSVFEPGVGENMNARRSGSLAYDKEEPSASRGGPPLLRRSGKALCKCYTKQLDRVQSSNISVQGRLPADILAELDHKANLVETGPADKQALAAIKAEEVVVPDLVAKDVAEEINSSAEFKSLDQLKEFLYAKRQALTKAHVELAKRSDAYQNIEHDLDVAPTHGK